MTIFDEQDDQQLAMNKPLVIDRTGNKSVSFKKGVKVREHPGLIDFSEDEIKRAWYNNTDYAMIKAEYLSTIKKMVSRKTFPDDETLCFRGLEYRTPRVAALRRQHKSEAIDLVLDEQCLQRSKGIHDPDYIAHLYRKRADHSARIAHLLGVQDGQFVHDQQEQESSSLLKVCLSDKKHSSSSSPRGTSQQGFIAAKIHLANLHRALAQDVLGVRHQQMHDSVIMTRTRSLGGAA
jgi:hypothetical protein